MTGLKPYLFLYALFGIITVGIAHRGQLPEIGQNLTSTGEKALVEPQPQASLVEVQTIIQEAKPAQPEPIINKAKPQTAPKQQPTPAPAQAAAVVPPAISTPEVVEESPKQNEEKNEESIKDDPVNDPVEPPKEDAPENPSTIDLLERLERREPDLDTAKKRLKEGKLADILD